jgi:hypothetical protein
MGSQTDCWCGNWPTDWDLGPSEEGSDELMGNPSRARRLGFQQIPLPRHKTCLTLVARVYSRNISIISLLMESFLMNNTPRLDGCALPFKRGYMYVVVNWYLIRIVSTCIIWLLLLHPNPVFLSIESWMGEPAQSWCYSIESWEIFKRFEYFYS